MFSNHDSEGDALLWLAVLTWQAGWVAGAVGIGALAGLSVRQTGFLAFGMFAIGLLFPFIGGLISGASVGSLQAASVAQHEDNVIYLTKH